VNLGLSAESKFLVIFVSIGCPFKGHPSRPKLCSKVLELAKGKVAVEVGAEKDLVPTLELIKTAVLNGELDTQIDAAANKLRLGFAQ
jgi:hypothetical protein